MLLGITETSSKSLVDWTSTLILMLEEAGTLSAMNWLDRGIRSVVGGSLSPGEAPYVVPDSATGFVIGWSTDAAKVANAPYYSPLLFGGMLNGGIIGCFYILPDSSSEPLKKRSDTRPDDSESFLP